MRILYWEAAQDKPSRKRTAQNHLCEARQEDLPETIDFQALCNPWLDESFAFILLDCSVAKSCPTLWPQGLQHARLPCPSLSPRVCSKSFPLSRWSHPTISSSVIPFSSCPQSFPSSGSFPMGWLLASDSQSIGASASASVLPMNIHLGFLF